MRKPTFSIKRPSAPGDTAQLTLAPPSARGGWWQHSIQVKKRKNIDWRKMQRLSIISERELKERKRENHPASLNYILFYLTFSQLNWKYGQSILLYVCLSNRELNFRKLLLFYLGNKITWGYPFVEQSILFWNSILYAIVNAHKYRDFHQV